MVKAVFVDIFTTQNDLYGKHNCPIQFSYELIDEEALYDNDKLFKNIENKDTINIIPDEDISIAGYLNSNINEKSFSDVTLNFVDLHTALERIYDYLLDFIRKGYYIIGYNHCKYDLKILNEHFVRVLKKDPISYDLSKIIDVMELSEALISVKKCGSYGMNTVFMSLYENIEVLNNLQKEKSTVTDIKITKLILRKLLGVISETKKLTLSQIKIVMDKLSAKVDTFNFGKYKGLTFKEAFDIDSQYISWTIKHSDKKYMVETLKNMINTTVN